jgi:hypothetical protein
MSAQFTPGPWQSEHRRGPHGMWNTEVFCAKGEAIATVCWYPMPTVNGVTGTYREANARLIAAAPRMFAVIEAGAKVGDAECIAIVEAVNGNA